MNDLTKPIEAVGGFYERPDGSIVKTYGCKDSGATIMFYEYKGGTQETPDSNTIGWKDRQDLREFPGCDDVNRRLPYEFDLYFDIKSKGEMYNVLEQRDSVYDKEFFDGMVMKYYPEVAEKYNLILN